MLTVTTTLTFRRMLHIEQLHKTKLFKIADNNAEMCVAFPMHGVIKYVLIDIYVSVYTAFEIAKRILLNRASSC